ncbi:MAG TPA: ABC transporter permease [Zeimonas sp.]
MSSTATFSRRVSALRQWRGFVLGAAVRELRARYARSLFGWIWLIVPPAVLIGIYTLVFSRMTRGAGLPDHGPYTYSIFLCAGMLTWQWFSELATRVVGLFTNNATLLKKTPTPWYALLAVEIVVTTAGLAIQMALFALLLALAGHWPGWNWLLMLPLLAAQGMFAIGLALGLAVFQVFLRDVGLTVPLVLQVWFWLTPIVYPASALPESYRHLLDLNLMTPIVQGYQSAVLFDGAGIDWRGAAFVAVLGAAAFLGSIRLVRRNLPAMRDEF